MDLLIYCLRFESLYKSLCYDFNDDYSPMLVLSALKCTIFMFTAMFQLLQLLTQWHSVILCNSEFTHLYLRFILHELLIFRLHCWTIYLCNWIIILKLVTIINFLQQIIYFYFVIWIKRSLNYEPNEKFSNSLVGFPSIGTMYFRNCFLFHKFKHGRLM